MRNYDWGFAPTPRQGYFPKMWPVDREATFGFGGSPAGGAPEPAPRRASYDAQYGGAPRGYDASFRRPAPFTGPRPGGGETRIVRPHGGDRVTFRDGRGGYGGDFGGTPRRVGGYGNDFGGGGQMWYDQGRGNDFLAARGGEYGGAHPGFGGYPGRNDGMYAHWDRGNEVRNSFRGAFDRGTEGYDRGYGGYSGGGMQAGGWGQGQGGAASYADAPFMPDEAYRRHPELSARPHHFDVAYGAPDDIGDELDDGELYQAVRQRLFQDRYVDAQAITIMVSDGVVTLEGEVGDYLEARYAWDDAWETPGVHGVVNRLVVRTDAPEVSHNDEMPQSAGGDTTA